MDPLLVLMETSGAEVLPATLPAIAFAQAWTQMTRGRFHLLLVGGPEIVTQAETWRGYGEERLLIASSPALAHPTADRVAAVTLQALRMTGARWLAGTSSTFGKDVLPRVAGLLNAPMISDALSVQPDDSGPIFRRPVYAGNLIATVQVPPDAGVVSVRATAFGSPARTTSGPVESLPVDPALLPQGTRWIGQDTAQNKRPDLTAARVVISGGRPLRDPETFEQILGALADKLGGALGATRAAVDSGIAPNELQIGQTGKVIAPELYIAAGVSGSVQHLAGIKDAKVIVAINIDGDAPIFQIADYGLVADLFQAVPELTQKL